MAQHSADPSTSPAPPGSPPDGPSRGSPGSAPDLEALSEAARGWHRIQLAVLGFIGFCGILWEGDATTPTVVQYAGLLLIVSAFVLAVVSILVVGRVAHPVGGPTGGADGSALAAGRTRHLRRGIWGTYLAVALLVLATLSSWLPAGGDAAAATAGDVRTGDARPQVLADVSARAWCGHLVHEDDEVVRFETPEGVVEVPLDRIALRHPVGAC